MDDYSSPVTPANTSDKKLIDLTAADLLKKFGKGGHKPGSGSAAAFHGLISAHLLRTVISLTCDRNRNGQYTQDIPALKKIDADVEERLLPALEQLFQLDSEQFDRVFKCRTERNRLATEPGRYKQAVDAALEALMPATEMPIEIGKCCADLASHALTVFDLGFRAARGDSGVAINSAIGALAGCLAIVELNLLSFSPSGWVEDIRKQRTELRDKLDNLNAEALRRLTEQFEASDMHDWYRNEVHSIAVAAKAKKTLSNREIESFARRLQTAMWRHRKVLWKVDVSANPYIALDPKLALEALGFAVARPAAIGVSPDGAFVVAGTIDQETKEVSVASQPQRAIQNFTMAHELGHAMLHTQAVLHRDRPLDGSDNELMAPEEKQANKFATYFLMPARLVRDSFEQIFSTAPFRITAETAFALMGGPATGRTPQALRQQCKTLRGLARLLASETFYNGTASKSLAELFSVSTEAMAIRLEELKLIEF